MAILEDILEIKNGRVITRDAVRMKGTRDISEKIWMQKQGSPVRYKGYEIYRLPNDPMMGGQRWGSFKGERNIAVFQSLEDCKADIDRMAAYWKKDSRDAGEFKKGDKVKIGFGEYAGRVGKFVQYSLLSPGKWGVVEVKPGVAYTLLLSDLSKDSRDSVETKSKLASLKRQLEEGGQDPVLKKEIEEEIGRLEILNLEEEEAEMSGDALDQIEYKGFKITAGPRKGTHATWNVEPPAGKRPKNWKQGTWTEYSIEEAKKRIDEGISGDTDPRTVKELVDYHKKKEEAKKKENKDATSYRVEKESGYYNIYPASGSNKIGKGYKTEEEAEKKISELEKQESKDATQGRLKGKGTIPGSRDSDYRGYNIKDNFEVFLKDKKVHTGDSLTEARDWIEKHPSHYFDRRET